MKKFLLTYVFLSTLASFAQADVFVIPTFNEARQPSLQILKADSTGGAFSSRTLVLPTVHGRSVTMVDFAEDKAILGSLLNREEEKSAGALPWVSACVSLESIVEGGPVELVPSCPFESHTLDALFRQLDIKHEEFRRTIGPEATIKHGRSIEVNPRLAFLNHRAQRRVPILRLVQAPAAEQYTDIYTALFLLDFEEQTVVQVAADADIPISYGGERITYDRYLSYTEAPSFRATKYDGKRADALKPGLKDLRGIVYDTETQQTIFRSEPSYLGLDQGVPLVNHAGTHVIWGHSDLPYDAGDGTLPHGGAGVTLYYVAVGTAERITPVGKQAYSLGWFPDGVRFLYCIYTSRTDSAPFIGDIHGRREKLRLTLSEVDSWDTALGSEGNRAWFSDGHSFITLKHTQSGTPSVYDMKVVHTDLLNMTSRVATNYLMPDSNMPGWGTRPYRVP